MRQNDINPEPRMAPQRAEDREVREEGRPEGERWVAGASSWQEIKSRFVDDPAGALQAAETLVRQAVEDRMRRMQEELEELRTGAQPGRDGVTASETEDLRTRLIRYQAYFESLGEVRGH